MHDLDEFPEVARDHFGRLGRAFREVVVSFVDDHRARAIGDHNAVRILIEVGKLRTAKASIDHIEGLHVRNERVPKAKTGTSRENNAAGPRRMNFVLFLKITNRRLPSLRQYLRQKGAHIQAKEHQNANPRTNEIASRRGADWPSHRAKTIPRAYKLQHSDCRIGMLNAHWQLSTIYCKAG